jgi:pimeloyl-ACP methyl ester carboxylesterase
VSRGIAVIAIVPIAVLALIGIAAPWSLSGWVALAACALVASAGFFGAARTRRLLRVLGAAAIAVLVLVRVAAPSGGSDSMLTLPGGTSSRWLGRVVDEQDVSLLGARALIRRWPMVREERDGLLRAMRDAYVEMRGDGGASPSPVLDTALGRQGATGFDALVLEPPQGPPRAAVIFLHGYGGNFRLECWLVAQAARSVGALTVCPAMGFGGHWGGREGGDIFSATLDYLHSRAIYRIYLAGLSNGAAGASAQAVLWSHALDGLILISGAPAHGSSGGLPALVIHGERDPIASVKAARAFAAGNHATYLGVDGGHFALLMHRGETGAAIADWLQRRESAAKRPAR